MKLFLIPIFLLSVASAMFDKSIVHDDGTGAQISFDLPVYETLDGKEVEYTVFRISVEKDNKFLLLADLSGTKTQDGNAFIGKIIIPSEFVNSAEILMLGSLSNSSLSYQKKIKVRNLMKVQREKSWTDQK